MKRRRLLQWLGLAPQQMTPYVPDFALPVCGVCHTPISTDPVKLAVLDADGATFSGASTSYPVIACQKCGTLRMTRNG